MTKDLNSVPDAMLTPHGKELAKAQRTSKPKLEDFPHPQGGYSTMSFHNALIYWQEREIERLQRDNDRLNDYIKGLPDNESCAHPAMKGTQAYKCELCGQLEERNADETDRDGSAKCPHCLTWRTAEEIGKGMCCDKDVPPEEPSGPRGKPCTCPDTSAAACGVERGHKLGELWFCKRAQVKAK